MILVGAIYVYDFWLWSITSLIRFRGAKRYTRNDKNRALEMATNIPAVTNIIHFLPPAQH